MSNDILTRARTLLGGITPGEWHEDGVLIVAGGDRLYTAEDCATIGDAAFIVSAPDLVRELCAEVEGLERILARRTMERDSMTEDWDKENDMRHAAEARAEKAERARDVLAEKLSNESCPHDCPHELAPDLEVCDACWIVWAAQEAEKEGGE